MSRSCPLSPLSTPVVDYVYVGLESSMGFGLAYVLRLIIANAKVTTLWLPYNKDLGLFNLNLAYVKMILYLLLLL